MEELKEARHRLHKSHCSQDFVVVVVVVVVAVVVAVVGGGGGVRVAVGVIEEAHE